MKASLWFVPIIICVIYFFATLTMYFFEMHILKDLEIPKLLYNGTTEDAKQVISTLMPSMITMATLAISITMVVLSLAASQLGPRIIKVFMGDRQTQIYMGIFLGAVVGCFVLTRILHDEVLTIRTPALTISLVFAMCFMNLFVLLAFVHHVAQSSIANNVIMNISEELKTAIERLGRSDSDHEFRVYETELPKNFGQDTREVHFSKSGYVQYINYQSIVNIASKHNLIIKLNCKAGRFVVEGEGGIGIWPVENASDEICKNILSNIGIGRVRTSTQDIEYSVRHLVEIAIRALSPGINDNFTAMATLDQLSAALSHLFKKELAGHIYLDDEKKCCLIADQNSEASVIMIALTQIRQSADTKPDVTGHLIKKIKTLAPLCTNKNEREALKLQLNFINENIEKYFKNSLEGHELKILYDEALKAFK